MESLEPNSTGSGTLTVPGDSGYGCLTCVSLGLPLPKMESHYLAYLSWEV